MGFNSKCEHSQQSQVTLGLILSKWLDLSSVQTHPTLNLPSYFLNRGWTHVIRVHLSTCWILQNQLSVAQLCPKAARAVSLTTLVPEQKESLLHPQQKYAVWQLEAWYRLWAYEHNCAEKRNHQERSIALRKKVENQVMNFISRPLPKLFPLPEIPFLFSDFWKNPTHLSRPNS